MSLVSELEPEDPEQMDLEELHKLPLISSESPRELSTMSLDTWVELRLGVRIIPEMEA